MCESGYVRLLTLHSLHVRVWLLETTDAALLTCESLATRDYRRCTPYMCESGYVRLPTLHSLHVRVWLLETTDTALLTCESLATCDYIVGCLEFEMPTKVEVRVTTYSLFATDRRQVVHRQYKSDHDGG